MIIKQLIYTISITAILIFTACKNNDDTTPSPTDHTHPAAQSHDQNKMMMMMHNSMKMDTMQHTGDPDNDFAMMMKMHHMGAIKMGDEELSSGNNAQIRDFATKMIAAQEKEVMEFDSFLKVHPPVGMNMDFLTEAKASMNKMETEADKQLIFGDTDHDFVSLMTPHHQSAIDMSIAYLKYGKDAKIRSTAEKIIADQKMEITELQKWLENN